MTTQPDGFPIQDPDDWSHEFVIDPNYGSLRLQIRGSEFRLKTWTDPEEARLDCVPSFIIEVYRDFRDKAD